MALLDNATDNVELSRVSQAFAKMNEAISALHAAIDTLEAKLTPALNPEVEVRDQSNSPEGQSQSALTAHVLDETSRIWRAAENVRDLNFRIEL